MTDFKLVDDKILLFLTELLFIWLLRANRILLACDLWNAPLLSNPMRVLFNHRFSPFEFSERSESQLLFPTQSYRCKKERTILINGDFWMALQK